MERYIEYKSSIVPGLKEIPAHWKEVLNGFLFKENVRKPKENDIPLSLSQIDGLIPTELMKENSLKTSSYDNWKRVVKHDLVLNRFKAHLGVLMASNYEGMVSFHYGVYEPRLPLITKYYELLYHTDVYKGIYSYSSNGMTVGLQNLSNLAFYSIKGIYPPLAEQEKIVSFLENKTSKIDSYVADKEKEIDLLLELKQKTIADAVTKGLNPDVTKKDSGISWLGMIPENWETKRIASLFTGKVKANSDFEYHHAFKFYYGTLVPKEETGDIEEYRDTYVKYSVLQKDDIMINGLNLNYDFVSQRVAIAPSDGIITSAYVVVRPRIGTNAQYYNYLFKTMDNMKLFHGMGTGIRLTLSFDELKKQLVIVPPQDEQQSIVTYIEEKCQKIDTLINDLKTEIVSLKEYKQRLIADVVTGQVNVQNL